MDGGTGAGPGTVAWKGLLAGQGFLMPYQCWIGDLSEWVNWSSLLRGWGVQSAGMESMQRLELRLTMGVLVSKREWL